MNATIYITYEEVNNNIEALLKDAQKLTYDHTTKASEILEQPRVDSINKVYGMFYMINGDAATQSQFYVTDSTKHFITGALYFNAKPNYDSIYPAVVYLRNDIRRIMESVHWK
jgi:gliding motility-associated lipoprotein GldD